MTGASEVIIKPAGVMVILCSSRQHESMGLPGEPADALGRQWHHHPKLTKYGLGVLATTAGYTAHKLGIVRVPRFCSTSLLFPRFA